MNAQTETKATNETETSTESKFVGAIANDKILYDKEAIAKITKINGYRGSYANAESAGTALEAIAKAFAPAEIPVPVIYQPGVEDDSKGGRVVIATLGRRDKKESRNGVIALTVFRLPTVEEFFADESELAKTWLGKLIDREAADVAFQSLRDADTYEELNKAIGGLATTVQDIVVSTRASGDELDTETFDTLWGPFRAKVAVDHPAIAKFIPPKGIFLKALRSASFAKAHPESTDLETRGLILALGKGLISAAAAWQDKEGKPAPLDASTIQEWIDGRDSLAIAYKAAEEKDASALPTAADLSF